MLKVLKPAGSELESDNDSSVVSENQSEASKKSSKAGRRKSKSIKNNNKPLKTLFRYNCHIVEEQQKQIFAVQFNHFIKDRNIFASTSSYRVSIYECVEPKESDDEGIEDDDGFCGIKLIRAYDDADRDEVLYTLAWSYEPSSGAPILAVGGVRSIVRVIYVNGPGLREKKFIGHTNAINEMKFHPLQPQILLTASKDHSMRLWNIKTDICIAILGGVGGHRDEVLAIDFDTDGKTIISGGMDHNLKVWKMDSDEIQAAIDSSETYFDSKRTRSFPTLHVHFSDFTTRAIHRNYVDSVKFFGESFLSKSCENSIVWWKLNDPKINFASTNVNPIHTFEIDDSELWFVRMDLDITQRYLAVGNSIGKIYVFDLDFETPNMIQPSIMSHYKCTKPIRQISINRTGEILVASTDDGKIFRWDKKD